MDGIELRYLFTEKPNRVLRSVVQRRSCWLPFVTIASLVLILFLRRSDTFYNPQFWAEDGVVFFSEAYKFGIRSLFIPQAGYFQVLQRVFALLGMGIPVEYVPAFFNFCALCMTLSVAVYLFSRRIPLSVGVKSLFALAIVALPIFDGEVMMSLTNTQWILALALILLVVSDEARTRAQFTFDILLLIIVGLTGPFAIVFLPLFGLRALKRKSRESVLLLLIAVAIAIIQSLDILTIHRVRGTLSLLNPDFLSVFVLWTRYIFLGWVEYDFAAILIMNFLLPAAGVLIYSFLIWVAVKEGKFFELVLVLAGLLVLTMTVLLFREKPDALLGGGYRYLYIPMVTLIWVLILLWRERKIMASIILVSILISAILNFRVRPLEDYNWREASKCIDTESECVIPINPPGWTIRIRD